MRLTREIDLYFSELHARLQERRRRKKWKADNRKRAKQRERDAAFGKRSKIIQMLADANASESGYTAKADARLHKGALDVVIPSTFSIIEAPEKAVATIEFFAKAIRQERLRSVNLNHAALNKYDLAANGLLDLVAIELNKEASLTKRRIKWRGQFPKDRHVQRFIRALGIIEHLGLKIFAPDADEIAELRRFDRRHRHYYREGRPDKADYKSKVVATFSDHINDCLKDNGRMLTPEARQKLCDYTGEILDNAQEHADMLDWTIQGYLDNALDTPICEIAIFNFGKTIAETLRGLSKDSYTWNQIQPYLTHYKRAGLFGAGWAEEDLLTVIALQGHVSSKNSSADGTRGNGTIDLITFFQKVHSECAMNSPIKATMAILSGGTHILFDGKYKLSEDDRGPKTIAFNAENDLNSRPDQNYVRSLKRARFPGTIISIRFPLSNTSTLAAKASHE